MTEVVALIGGPLDGSPAVVAEDQLGIEVRAPLIREGKRSLNAVIVGVYQPNGTVSQGWECWDWRPLWESAA
jgi:hypothetical protein